VINMEKWMHEVQFAAPYQLSDVLSKRSSDGWELVAVTSSIQPIATGGDPPVVEAVSYTLFFKKRDAAE
jgi:hypothetical protein